MKSSTVLGIITFAIILLVGSVYITQLTWNYLFPSILEGNITLTQAFLLLVLGRLLTYSSK